MAHGKVLEQGSKLLVSFAASHIDSCIFRLDLVAQSTATARISGIRDFGRNTVKAAARAFDDSARTSI